MWCDGHFVLNINVKTPYRWLNSNASSLCSCHHRDCWIWDGYGDTSYFWSSSENWSAIILIIKWHLGGLSALVSKKNCMILKPLCTRNHEFLSIQLLFCISQNVSSNWNLFVVSSFYVFLHINLYEPKTHCGPLCWSFHPPIGSLFTCLFSSTIWPIRIKFKGMVLYDPAALISTQKTASPWLKVPLV